jgi:hypothetical protein
MVILRNKATTSLGRDHEQHPNTTQELLEAAWRHCGAIQDIIDGLSEAATNTEPRVLANWLHRLAFRLQPTTSEKINQSKGLAEAL